MKEVLYKQLQNNWHYVHPVTKRLSQLDYLYERIIEMLQHGSKIGIKTILKALSAEVKKV